MLRKVREQVCQRMGDLMSNSIAITVYAKAQPQGSSKGFPIMRANGKMGISITSANKHLKPFRQEVAYMAIAELAKADGLGPFAEKHVPVTVALRFYFRKPPSVSKKRTHMVVKPDIDKTVRAVFDSLKGIFWHDDAQVVSLYTSKCYDGVERVEICVSKVGVAA